MENFGSAALTTVSLSDRVPLAPDRRTEQRHMSVLRVGKIISGDHDQLCLIRNISCGGLMAHVYSDFAPGDRVAIEIRNGHVLTGRVVWGRNAMLGMQFDERIDVLHFLADEQEEQLQGMAPRSPRVRIHAPALVRRGADYFHADVLDISQGGAKLTHGEVFSPDDEVVLTLTGLSPIMATVRWQRDGCAGVVFHQYLAFDLLARWAAAYAR